MTGVLTFATVMDMAVLALLAVTVFLGFRLTNALRNFRESRQDMEGLLNRLVAQISKAENAIAGMQNSTRTSGVQLQEIINESKFLADELRFMNEAGNSLADRLEKLADKNRVLVSEIEQQGGIGAVSRELRELETIMEEDDLAGFSYGENYADEDYPDQDVDFAERDMLQSQAERELFEALSKSRRKHKVGA